ncbi:hypothetical protein [Flagellimonas lutimaris]|uniref:hypothetical protein n=1 Tax=Flagellimonas lutimaris TaxID=475082 RepID=UPI003F5CE5FD
MKIALSEDFPLRFELEQITYGLSGEVLDKASIGRNETFLFNSSTQFFKIIVQNGDTQKMEGSFTIDYDQKIPIITLEYKNENVFIQSCSNKSVEKAILKSNNILIISALACDGAELVYRLKE